MSLVSVYLFLRATDSLREASNETICFYRDFYCLEIGIFIKTAQSREGKRFLQRRFPPRILLSLLFFFLVFFFFWVTVLARENERQKWRASDKGAKGRGPITNEFRRFIDCLSVAPCILSSDHRLTEALCHDKTVSKCLSMLLQYIPSAFIRG